jgi:hypothetical protein
VDTGNRIVAILFTWSWSGFVIRFQDGPQRTFSPRELRELVGETEYARLRRIAHRLPGHWHQVEEPGLS